jgi:hypothetical protein
VTTQTLTLVPQEPIFADSRDYGFDFDEEEVGRELRAPLPASFLRPQDPEAEANECEKVFELFIA